MIKGTNLNFSKFSNLKFGFQYLISFLNKWLALFMSNSSPNIQWNSFDTKTNQHQDIISLFAQISKSLSKTWIDDYMQSIALIMKSMTCKFVWLPNYSCEQLFCCGHKHFIFTNHQVNEFWFKCSLSIHGKCVCVKWRFKETFHAVFDRSIWYKRNQWKNLWTPQLKCY